MKFLDLVKMAFQNLYRRKVRSAFNLSGIILGCTLLLLTLAAVTGIRQTLYRLFDESDIAKQIFIVDSRPEKFAPPKNLKVAGGKMSKERRSRIQSQLEDNWMNENVRFADNDIKVEQIKRFKEIKHVKSVVPRITLYCDISLDGRRCPEQAIESASSPNRSNQASITDGHWIDFDEGKNQVLLNEFTAYKLGCRNEDDFHSIVGKEVTFNFYSKEQPVLNMLDRFLEFTVGTSENQYQNTLEALSELNEKLDASSISAKSKSTLKAILALVPNPSSKKPKTVLEKKFTIAGIYKPQKDDITEKIFRSFYRGPDGQVKMHHQTVEQLYFELGGKPSFYSVMAEVDSSKNLTQVVKELEENHVQTISAAMALDRLESQLNQGGWAIYGIVSIILLVSAIGISNTLFSSTFERTPEFGIMKAVGSSDRTILFLMLTEGLLLGISGALFAVILGISGSMFAQHFLTNYLQQRYEMESPESFLFQFSTISIVVVFTVSILVCMLASFIPGWRAAKLDPIRAMQRR